MKISHEKASGPLSNTKFKSSQQREPSGGPGVAAPQTPRGRGPQKTVEPLERDSFTHHVRFKVRGKPSPQTGNERVPVPPTWLLAPAQGGEREANRINGCVNTMLSTSQEGHLSPCLFHPVFILSDVYLTGLQVS